MQVIWSNRAARELDELMVYIADQSLDTAFLVVERIVQSSAFLELTPFLGRKSKLKNTRELPVPRTGYLLMYTVGVNEVTILAVRRGARDR